MRKLLPIFLTALACNGAASIDLVSARDPLPPDVIDPSTNPDNPSPSMACDFSFSYQGFGGTRLEVGREDQDVGFDRDRVKPLSALGGEYARVLGKTPALLSSLGSTFGQVPPRWFVEPQANAVSLYSSRRVDVVG